MNGAETRVSGDFRTYSTILGKRAMKVSPIADSSFFAELSGITHVGRYTVTKELGRGGMAVVFLGRDPYIQRQVAVKMSRPHTEEEKTQFFVEAQSAGRLNHPNLVAVYDAGVHGRFCYIAMELVEGHTLDRYCQPENLLPPKKAAEIVFSVLNALDYAHKQGVIHRDIKPSNIMLDKNGDVKIADFGIARIKGLSTMRVIRGTPSYMSPEQVKGEPIKDNTDIFSAGCVLFELLTGVPAFGGEDFSSIIKKIVESDPPPILRLRPELPKIFEDVIQKALAKDPTVRYQSCLDFAYDLRVAVRGLAAETLAAPEKPKSALEYIRYVPFFANFTPRQLEELFQASDILKVKKGKVVVAQGEIDDTFFIILSGSARIEKDGQIIARVGMGECFGEMAYIGGQARVATVVADTDLVLMKISATILDRAPGPIQLLFFKNFAKFLVKRFSMFFNKQE